MTAPITAFKRLVLPEPFGPTIVTISPASIVKLTFFNATTPLYATVRLSIVIYFIAKLGQTCARVAKASCFDDSLFNSKSRF